MTDKRSIIIEFVEVSLCTGKVCMKLRVILLKFWRYFLAMSGVVLMVLGLRFIGVYGTVCDEGIL